MTRPTIYTNRQRDSLNFFLIAGLFGALCAFSLGLIVKSRVNTFCIGLTKTQCIQELDKLGELIAEERKAWK